MALDRENVLRKIRALMALAAPGSGATPSERSTANLLAWKLKRDYGITDRDILWHRPERKQFIIPTDSTNVSSCEFIWNVDEVTGSASTASW